MTTETLAAILPAPDVIAPPAPACATVVIRPRRTAARAARASLYARHLKPVVDLLLVLVGLLVAGPVMLLVALLIKLDSPGPALYTQTRVGHDRRRRGARRFAGRDRRQRDLGGRPFRIVKFRSMRRDAEAATGPVWAQGNGDPRVTRVGRFLRASHLDELPQLFNVFRGEMSMVGPRPERPEFFVDLVDQVPRYGDRTKVRPGITGLAQVRHKYDSTLDDVRRKVALDLDYIQRVGVTTDLQILFGTVGRCYRELRQAIAARRPAPPQPVVVRS